MTSTGPSDESIVMKIAIVDDHRLFKDGLARILNSDTKYRIVLEANNGHEFLASLEKLDFNDFPNIVILDISMPIMDGISTAAVLKTKYSGIKTIVLSMHSSETYIVGALQQGVAGYLTKDAEAEELLNAINEVYSGGKYFSRRVSAIALNYLSSVNSEDGRKLTPKEIQIVKLILREKTTTEISRQLLISSRTVDAHIQNIMAKLDVQTRVGIVVQALKNQIITLEGGNKEIN